MDTLRRMLSREYLGSTLARAGDDLVIDQAAHWHVHGARPEPAEAEAAESKGGWKRVPGVARAPGRARKCWRVKTRFGDCLLVRAADLVPGEEFLEDPRSVPAGIIEMTRGVEAPAALGEIHAAVYGDRPASAQRPESWMAQQIDSAFRRGLLVLVRQEVRGTAAGEGTTGAPAASAAAQAKAAGAPSPGPSPAPPKATEKTWFRMQLLDEDGEPMPGEDYVVVDSAGARRQGKLDDSGELYIPPILPPGTCTVTFPNIHLHPRKKKK